MCKERGFFSADAGADLQNDVAVVIRVTRQQQDAQLLLELRAAGPALLNLLARDPVQLGVVQQRLCLCDLHTQAIDADYSEALYNHKAILVDSGKDLIAFPAENSYLVYGYSADDGFTLRKEIPVSQWDENNRGLYIGDYFYVVGSDQVNVLDLGTLENVAQAIIPRG